MASVVVDWDRNRRIRAWVAFGDEVHAVLSPERAVDLTTLDRVFVLRWHDSITTALVAMQLVRHGDFVTVVAERANRRLLDDLGLTTLPLALDVMRALQSPQA